MELSRVSTSSISMAGIPPLIRCFFFADILLCLLFLLNHFSGFRVLGVFNLNSESSFATWYSSMQLLCIALLSLIFVLGYRRRHSTSRKTLSILPLLFLFLSIDEIAQIHEKLGKLSDYLLAGGTRENSIFHQTGIWMLVLGVPFIIFFLVWTSSLSLKKVFASSEIFWRFVIGMGVFLFGALGFETLSNFANPGNALVMVIVFEEGLEMFGATLMLWAVYSLVTELEVTLTWK
jgi:hypothetical protein